MKNDDIKLQRLWGVSICNLRGRNTAATRDRRMLGNPGMRIIAATRATRPTAGQPVQKKIGTTLAPTDEKGLTDQRTDDSCPEDSDTPM
jgi:hypothetical protein